MAADITSSIVLINSSDSSKRGFGTGFVVYQDGQAGYVVTCAHVVRAVDDREKPESLIVAGRPATVAGIGEDDFPDLAVLRVEDFCDVPPLPLQAAANKGDTFLTAGFQEFKPNYLLRPLRGELGAPINIVAPNHLKPAPAWDLTTLDQFHIERGYSGSPVVAEQTGAVAAVVTNAVLQSVTGYALSISNLIEVWPDMPSNLLTIPISPLASAATVKPSMFSASKHGNLQKKLSLLIKQYEAVSERLLLELSPATKVILEQQVEKLEQEIRETEQELNTLTIKQG